MKPGKILTGYQRILLIFLLIACHRYPEDLREKINFDAGWKFDLKDSSVFIQTNYEDSHWRLLNLPHDWSIEGTFSPDNPAGISGGALPGGIGWYRKSFLLPCSDSLRNIFITFDGVYHNSEVYINGHFLGKRPNGYISFQYELTPYLNFGTTPNVIAVRVDNSDQPNSRWYSGSGIYRHVWLEKMSPVHVDLWGTHISTLSVNKSSASVGMTITARNNSKETVTIEVVTSIFDQDNKEITSSSGSLTLEQGSNNNLYQDFVVDTPDLWSVDHPSLYKAITILKINNQIIDQYETPFGIRYFKFDPEQGFSLNGKRMKIKGVCNHHDLGALGTAVNTRAIERQLDILKEMGCNSIRTSHNPPAPELLELCDRKGFLVMDESFDMWAKDKVDHDYSTCWAEWHERDLTDHLRRDRNHPSVIIWSIGNEIREQWDSTGTSIAKELTAIVKRYSPGLPVTSGLDNPQPSNFIYRSGMLDLVGFNYHTKLYEQFPGNFPGQVFIGSETNSGISSRGEYDMPGDSIRIWPVSWDIPFTQGNPDHSCSAYDNCVVPWGSTHDETWKLVKAHDYLSGMFIWTGFDYLGEPTPYQWPSRSSYFGLVDLAGFPKDSYYFYKSEWTENPVLHIFPHWNWNAGQEIDIWAYTNFEAVELFVNGKSVGLRSRSDKDLHLEWHVIFEPGTIKAIGQNKSGETGEVIIKTAGEPARLEMIADRQEILADGTDLSFITINVLDKDGIPVPNADNQINFEVTDKVVIAGVDNGSQTSMESFKGSRRKAFNGKCLLIVQSGLVKGNATIKATSDRLEPAVLQISLK